jgi:hypothetical protein
MEFVKLVIFRALHAWELLNYVHPVLRTNIYTMGLAITIVLNMILLVNVLLHAHQVSISLLILSVHHALQLVNNAVVLQNVQFVHQIHILTWESAYQIVHLVHMLLQIIYVLIVMYLAIHVKIIPLNVLLVQLDTIIIQEQKYALKINQIWHAHLINTLIKLQINVNNVVHNA